MKANLYVGFSEFSSWLWFLSDKLLCTKIIPKGGRGGGVWTQSRNQGSAGEFSIIDIWFIDLLPLVIGCTEAATGDVPEKGYFKKFGKFHTKTPVLKSFLIKLKA